MTDKKHPLDSTEPVNGDIRKVGDTLESFYEGEWYEEECTCDEGLDGSDNCIYRFPVTWPREAADK